MEEVFIEDAEDDVDHKDGDKKQQVEVGKRVLENVSGSLNLSCDGGRKGLAGQVFDFRDGRAECIGADIEKNVHGRKAVEPVDI